MKKHRALIFAVVVTAFICLSGTITVGHAEEVDLGITQALEEIINAIDPGEQLPEEAGQLSSRWVNEAFGDTSFAVADAEISINVDTGWDMSNVQDTIASEPEWDTVADTEYEFLMAPGDSIVVAIPIVNQGNNASSIEFNAHHLIEGTDMSNDTFTMELGYRDGEHGPEDLTGANDVTDAEGTIDFTMGEVKTLFAVINIDADAADGDSTASEFFVTNNAPPDEDSPEYGDNWSYDEGPGSGDYRDTQALVFVTEVAGPVISIDKQFADGETPEDKRPGATVGYELTVENIGSAVAKEVIVVDAIPQFTTYPGDADAPDGVDIDYEETLGGDNWQETMDAENVEMIRWSWDELDDGESDEVTFSVTID